MARDVYVYRDAESFKIWGYDLFVSQETHEAEVIYYWGPCGKPMQQLQKTRKTGTHAALDAQVRDKIDEKLREGYRPVPNHVYFAAVDQFIDAVTQGMKAVVW